MYNGLPQNVVINSFFQVSKSKIRNFYITIFYKYIMWFDIPLRMLLLHDIT